MGLEEEIRQFVVASFFFGGSEEILFDADLTGRIDSTAMMELVTWVSSKYGFDVDLDDLTPEHFGSIARIAAYVRDKAPRFT